MNAAGILGNYALGNYDTHIRLDRFTQNIIMSAFLNFYNSN